MKHYKSPVAKTANLVGTTTVCACLSRELTAMSLPGGICTQLSAPGFVEVAA